MRGAVANGPGGLLINAEHVPTDETRQFVLTNVKVLTHQMLASRMGISVMVLKRHYRQELYQGRAEVTAALGASLIKKAMNGNMEAIKFYLRTQGGWAAKTEITGPDGGPIDHRAVPLDLSAMTEEQLDVLIPLLESLAGPAVDGSGDAPSDTE